MPSPVYLMDASAFIHRAFHAIRNLRTKTDHPSGAAYGFTATLIKLLKDKKPKALAVIYDSPGPSHRYELYPLYKANRGPMDADLAAQQSDIREIVSALGLFSLEEKGFEADDLIAAAARKFANEGREVVIVSSDKDFYQLLSDKISMYDPDPKKDSALTVAVFQERYGLNPASFLDMQALMGDSSDNIPGVPKVGEKTALKLILQFKSLDALYQRLDEVTPEKLRQNLAEHRDQAYLSKELAALGQGAKAAFMAEDLKPALPDQDRLSTIFQKLEFTRFLKELNSKETTGEATGKTTQKTNGENLPGTTFETHALPENESPVNYDKYVLVDNPAAWDQAEAALKEARTLAVDLETDSPSPSRCRIVGLSFCAEPGLSFYIPISHQTLDAVNQPWEEVVKKIGPALTSAAVAKIGQNAKFDWLILRRHGLSPNPPKGDPMLASYLLDPENRHGLDHLAKRLLGHQNITFAEMVPDKKKNFGDLSPFNALNYAAEDSDVTLRLAHVLHAELAEEPELSAIYEDIELPLEDLLARMEGHGVLIDAGRLNACSNELGGRLKTLEEKIFNLAGRAFNIGSPKQLSEILFQEQGLTPIKKTASKKAFSTDDEVLAGLALLHPLPLEVRNWRTLEKLRSTYTDKLPKEINPETGRVHTSYNQTLTATGRLSSSDPNLQNIPVRGDEGRRIREAFVASPGFCLISADYSQIELRVLAHFSKDEALLKAFTNDEDIHTQTAAEIFGVKPEQITSDQRREAKTINFGIVYGQGAFGLGKQLGIPQSLAREFITRYFARFPGVQRYMDETKAKARESGWVTTWFGRRRRLSGLSGGYQARQEAERMAINTPIQGTAADLIKMAMLAVNNRLVHEHPEARLIMQVHDELVVEAPENEKNEIARILQEEMAAVGVKPPLKGGRPLEVDLKVDVGCGPDWATAH